MAIPDATDLHFYKEIRSDCVSWKRVRDLVVSDDTVLDPTSSGSGSKSTTTKANAKLSPSQQNITNSTIPSLPHHRSHDAVWKDIFLPEDLNAIINFKKPMLPKLPANFEEYLLSYNGKKDVKSLVARRREVDFDPFEAPELYWAHKAIVEASDLFVYNYLPFQDHSESDLIHQIWSFGEKAVQLLESEEMRPMDRALVPLHQDDPRRKNEAASHHEKYNCVSSLKPRLRFAISSGYSGGWLSTYTSEYCAAFALSFVYNLSGLYLTAYIMDSPAGKACRITKVGPFEFPRSPTVFAKKVIPLLALTWQMKTLMNAVVRIVEEDETIIMPSTDNCQATPLILDCVSSPKLSPRKRNHDEVDE
ncbi:hypothetical protein BDB00DRAFT_880541 [Zychaea mexicana]|uniref:uncharacterized protein n=1 Tax=Zychaea mexicana TaxID=64656 RepID=UPI0022FEB4F7|nr:uncharacterized protein BDB00DRAFT_880541 [Zychaea mexicana]KAI9467535.1 hypothetical protein BDB00DRAFT_880541 [Zychaea mexicana]